MLPSYIEVEVPCQAPGCEGSGNIKHPNVRIDPSFVEKHLREHAYTVAQGSRVPIGADCDCPRIVGKPIVRSCQACKGEGRRVMKVPVPRPKTKVSVINDDALEEVFGDDPPDGPGTVFDVQGPDEHHLELETGIGVRVTWDRLTQAGTIPRGESADLWIFDLLDLEIVE